jgi:hypothetical protein
VNSADPALQNEWKAIGALGGSAELLNPTSYAGAGNQAASTVAGLSEANSQANQVGFGNSFLNSFGSAAGNLLGGGNIGGNAGGFGGMGLGG